MTSRAVTSPSRHAPSPTGRRNPATVAAILASLTLLCACGACDSTGGANGDGAACLRAVSNLDGPRSYVYSVDWSPVDDYVLAGTNEELRLLSVDTEARTMQVVATLADRARAAVVQWSSDGQFALTAGTEVKLLAITRDPPAITQLAAFTGHQLHVYGLAWSPDGTHALTGGEDGTVRLLAVDPAAGTLAEEHIFYGHVGKVLGVSWSPDGRHAVSVGADGTVRLLAVDLNAEPPTMRQLALETAEDQENASSWVVGPETVLTGTWSQRHAVQVWSVDVEAGAFELRSEFLEHPTGIDVLEWTRDRERIVTGGHDDTIRLSTFADGALRSIAVLADHSTGVHSVSWSLDETYMVLASSFIDRVSLVDARGCPGSAASP